MDRFDIYFSGELIPGTTEQTARERLGALFGMDERTLDTLFGGKPVRVKSGVDADKAGRYRAAFRKAGALITVVPQGTSPQPVRETTSPPAPPAADPAPPAAPDFELLPPRTGSLADCAPEVETRPIGDIDWMRLDSPGVVLDDSPPPPEPQFDLSGLTASAPGSFTLEDCAIEKPPVELPDIGHLSLAAGDDDQRAED